MEKNKVAIIGGGPSGLTALKSLLEEGLQPVLFEQCSNIGGQWNQSAPHSGIWKNMHTNTSSITTVFSDFPNKENIQIYPTNQEILEYLENYARHFKLNKHIRLNTTVNMVTQTADGEYKIQYTSKDGKSEEEIFSHVIIASGRYNKPRFPKTGGTENFKGTILHSFNYPGSDAFTGKKVAVVGNSISGLEIASDLAEDNSIKVISSCRKARYILRKMMGNKPTDCALFIRFATLARQALSTQQMAEGMKETILKNFGNPADHGGIKPSENIMEAGIAMCENYLAQVSENKITAKGAIKEFKSDTIIFEDGSEIELDAIIFATGYDLNLSFLSKEILQTINADNDHADLYQFTFHPDLPSFAFIGMYSQIGPHLPTSELQARWIAACWSGVRELPSKEQMINGINVLREIKKQRPLIPYHEAAVMLSTEAGVAPQLENHPELAKALLFGPLSPAQFRIDGHGKNLHAKENFIAMADNFGTPAFAELDEKEMDKLKMVAAALKDNSSLQKLLEQLQIEYQKNEL